MICAAKEKEKEGLMGMETVNGGRLPLFSPQLLGAATHNQFIEEADGDQRSAEANAVDNGANDQEDGARQPSVDGNSAGSLPIRFVVVAVGGIGAAGNWKVEARALFSLGITGL